MPATFTVGVESSFESLKDYSYEGVAKTYEEMKTPTVDQDVKIGSFFFQNEWSNKRFSVLLGGRVDKHNLIDDAIFSPRVNFRYNPTESISFRLSYAAGFRAPQAFDEDLHIGNVGDEVSRINLDPNLKEEKSQSLSLSADLYQKWGEKWQANFMVNGFYTILDDAFTLVEDTKRNTEFAGDGVTYKLRVNSSGSKVYGLNVDGKLAYGNKVQFQGGMTFEKAEYEDPQSSLEIEALKSRRITRTPDYYGYLVASYNPIKPLQISLNGTYTGEMLVLHETVEKNVETPNFYDVGTKISYNFKVNKNLTMQLNGGVNNIFNEYQDDFDKGADRDSGYIYGPSSPRTFFAGAKISF